MKDYTGDGVLGGHRYYQKINGESALVKLRHMIVWFLVSIAIILMLALLIAPNQIGELIIGGVK